MKYLIHGTIIFSLICLFLGTFGGLGVLYYGVWTIILALKLVLLVTGVDFFDIVKKDTEYFNNLKGGDGEIKNENLTEEVAENVMGKMIKYVSIMVIAFGIVIWQFLGLLTTNWFVFLVLILLGFFVHLPINILVIGRDKTMKVFNWFWGVMRIGVILYAILNAFHFHIDTYQWFLSLFS